MSNIESVFWGTLLAIVATYVLRGETDVLLTGPRWLARYVHGVIQDAVFPAAAKPPRTPPSPAAPAPSPTPSAPDLIELDDDDDEEDSEEVVSAPERFAMGTLKTLPAPL